MAYITSLPMNLTWLTHSDAQGLTFLYHQSHKVALTLTGPCDHVIMNSLVHYNDTIITTSELETEFNTVRRPSRTKCEK